MEPEQTQSKEATESLEHLTAPDRPLIPARLTRAMEAIAGMRHPSVAKLLHSHGYEYEAIQMTELVEAWAELFGAREK